MSARFRNMPERLSDGRAEQGAPSCRVGEMTNVARLIFFLKDSYVIFFMLELERDAGESVGQTMLVLQKCGIESFIIASRNFSELSS